MLVHNQFLLLVLLETNDLPFLVLNVSNGELRTHLNQEITPLSFPAGSEQLKKSK
jgi:hypothetical protein